MKLNKGEVIDFHHKTGHRYTLTVVNPDTDDLNIVSRDRNTGTIHSLYTTQQVESYFEEGTWIFERYQIYFVPDLSGGNIVDFHHIGSRNKYRLFCNKGEGNPFALTSRDEETEYDPYRSVEEVKKLFQKGMWIFDAYHCVTDVHHDVSQNVYDAEQDMVTDGDDETHTGGSSSYYTVRIEHPQGGEEAYNAECLDIIEALGMTFSEANVFKAVWRRAAARNGKKKKGNNAVYDAEKMVFFSERILAQEKVEQEG